MYLIIFNEKSIKIIPIFQSFFNEVKTQFDVSIGVLHSDNGR